MAGRAEKPADDRGRSLSFNRRRVQASTMDEVKAVVQAIWPNGFQEGSTGFERSWCCATEHGRRLVAHSWLPRRDMAWFWVRVAASLEDTLDADMSYASLDDPRRLVGLARQLRP